MKFRKRVLTVPDGDPVVGARVTLTRQDDSAVEASGSTDSEGWVDLETNGAPGNCWIQIDQGGSRRYDDSRSVRPYGSMNPGELVDTLNVLLTDGVLPCGDRFQITRGTSSLTVGTGGAILNGVVGIWYSETTVTPEADGSRMLVVQWSGTGRIRLLDVAYSASPTDQVVLATYTVSAGVISALTWVGIPVGSAFRGGYGAVTGIARVASGGTGSAVGEDAGLSVTLTLRTGVEYTIYAEGSVVSDGHDGAIAVEVDSNLSSYQSGPGDRVATIANAHARTKTGGSCVVRLYDRSDTLVSGWQLQATYGPTFNSLALSNPAQVAVSPTTGKIAIADTGNDRVVVLTSAGVYDSSITNSISGVTGVAYDSSGNLYTSAKSGGSTQRLRKYDTSLVLVWSVNQGDKFGTAHLTTDSTYVWLCDTVDHKVYRHLCSDGSAATSFGNGGSTDGKFGSGGPYGITNDGTYLYVSDPGNSRMQKFTVAGSYVRQWFGTSAGLRGVAIDASGNLLLVDMFANEMQRYTSTGTLMDRFAQANPFGIGVASGDVLWISNGSAGTIAKWDEVSSSFSWQAGLLAAVAIPR